MRIERYEDVTTSPNEYFTNVWNVLGVTIPFGLTQATVPFNRSDFEFDPMIVNAFYEYASHYTLIYYYFTINIFV